MLRRSIERWMRAAFLLERHGTFERLQAGMSRRGFIQGVGALTLAACTGTKKEGPVDDRRPQVAILGAGFAGLTCLHRLRNKGIDAVCYERAERVGGRVLTARGLFQGVTGAAHAVELGGEFIDTDHEDLLALARELGLELRDLTGNPDPEDAIALDRVYWSEGRRIDEVELLTGFVPVAHAIVEARQAMGSDDIGYDSDNAQAIRYDRMTLAEFLQSAQASAAAVKVLDAAYTCEYGVALEEQSALNLIMMLSDDNLAQSAGGDAWAVFGDSDERWQVVGGNDQIATRIAERHAARVRLGWSVEQIAQRPGGGWRIAFEGGREVDADVVVCTIPYSVLRTIPIRAELSEVKRRCIAELGYGNNAKLIVPFSRRVWEQAGEDGAVYADLECQSTWATDPWVEARGGVLANFVGGRRGVSLAEGTASDQARRLAADLDEIWPGAAAAAGIEAAVRRTWADDPHARGSYAAYYPGQWTSLAGAEPEPVADTLLFAGEHTSSDFQGFMGGAVESGVRAAKEVLALIR